MLCHARGAYAQLYDKTWVTGWGGFWNYDSILGGFSNFYVTIEEGSSPNFRVDSLGISFDRFGTTMSDGAGDSVLFYTNGVKFWNGRHQLMQNGDSLGWGWYLKDYDPDAYTLGVRAPKTGVCLPTDSSHIFYYFHVPIDSVNGGIYMVPRKMAVARINVTQNELTYKDSTVFEDILYSYISATKVANNKGWWIATPVNQAKCLYLIQIDSTSHISYQKICDNNFQVYSPQSLVALAFTNDGSKLIISGADYDYAGMEIMNFDRCTGELTLIEKFDIPMLSDSDWIPWTIVSSPNSRFIYAMCSAVVLQFDLWAEDIKGSMNIVAYFDTTPAPQVSMDLFQAQLAIDGKIYINGGSTVNAYRVIENPDELGTACNVTPNLIMPAYAWFPSYPNYRLGSMNCDSGVGMLQIDSAHIRAYPNPVASQLWVEYDGIRWEISQSITLGIHDALGREVYSKKLPMYSAIHNVDVHAWSAGMYIFSLYAGEKEIGNGKFVKE